MSNIVEIFEAKVRENPDDIVLNERINEIANYLKENYQLYSGDFIAIISDDEDLNSIVALAILKCGCVYLITTEEEIDSIIKDTNPKVILTKEYINKITHHNKNNPINLSTSSSFACLIYTSNKNGVIIEHGAIVNMQDFNFNTFLKDVKLKALEYIKKFDNFNFLTLNNKIVLRSAYFSKLLGEIPLTPIQSSFFENFKMLEHSNQSILLNVEDLNENILKIVLKELTNHHDILRVSFYENDEKVLQEIKESVEVDFYSIDLRTNKNPMAMLDFYIDRINSSLTLKNRLFKVVLFRLLDGNKLFIAIHNLLVDKKSLKILIKDLKSAYLDYLQKGVITFLPKTNSYKEYANAIKNYLQNTQFEIESLENFEIKKDFEVSESLESDSEIVEIILDKNLALTTLSKAICKWQNIEAIAIDLKSEKRDFFGFNFAETIGNFTYIYPIIVENDRVLKLKTNFKPEISFCDLNECEEFEIKESISSEAKRVYSLEFIALSKKLIIKYSKNEFKKESISQLCELISNF